MYTHDGYLTAYETHGAACFILCRPAGFLIGMTKNISLDPPLGVFLTSFADFEDHLVQRWIPVCDSIDMAPYLEGKGHVLTPAEWDTG